MEGLPARYVMHGLVALSYGVNLGQRTVINFLIPAIAADPSVPVDASSVGLLLGAFFPFYCSTQIPGGLIGRVVGDHRVIGLNLAAVAAMFFAVPAAARRGPLTLAAVFAAMGAIQASPGVVPCPCPHWRADRQSVLAPSPVSLLLIRKPANHTPHTIRTLHPHAI